MVPSPANTSPACPRNLTAWQISREVGISEGKSCHGDQRASTHWSSSHFLLWEALTVRAYTQPSNCDKHSVQSLAGYCMARFAACQMARKALMTEQGTVPKITTAALRARASDVQPASGARAMCRFRVFWPAVLVGLSSAKRRKWWLPRLLRTRKCRHSTRTNRAKPGISMRFLSDPR